jgi:hypothetical protein
MGRRVGVGRREDLRIDVIELQVRSTFGLPQ